MEIPEKRSMRLIHPNVYAKGSLVYKFINNLPRSLAENECEALRRVKNIPGTQQIVDFDADKMVLVTELVKGHHIAAGSPEYKTGVLRYTPEQLRSFFQTLVTMKERGVEFEVHSRNLFYRARGGFTPIDYCVCGNPTIDLESIFDVLNLHGWRPSADSLLSDGSYTGRPDPNPALREKLYQAFSDVSPKEFEVALQAVEVRQKEDSRIMKLLRSKAVFVKDPIYGLPVLYLERSNLGLPVN